MKSVEQKQRIGLYIRQLREARHETQIELATAIGVERSAVCQWEKGKTMPSIRSLRELSNHFAVPFEELLDGGPRQITDPGAEQILKMGRIMADALSSAYTALWSKDSTEQGGESDDSKNGGYNSQYPSSVL